MVSVERLILPAITPDTPRETIVAHVEDLHILPGPNHFTRPADAHRRMHLFGEGMIPHTHEATTLPPRSRRL